MILTALFGALGNRINGGLKDALPDGKIKDLITRLGSVNIMLGMFFITMLLSHGLIMAIFATAGMYAGQSWGWGRYVGALGRWEQRELKEVAFIDHLLARWGIKPQSSQNGQDVKGGKLYTHTPAHKLQQWGFVGLALRGSMWGSCIWVCMVFAWILSWIIGIWFAGFDVAFPAPWPVIGGLLMPLVYYQCIEAARLIWGKPGKGWPLAEWAFGGILWPLCAM